MQIFAHSSDGPQTEWELLEEHLRRVSECSAQFARKLQAEAWGLAAGMLHDVGKAKPGFQAYIRGSGKSVTHATEGAHLAAEHYAQLFPPPFSERAGRLLAFAIAGHHAGLPNGLQSGSGLRSLTERLTAVEVDPAWRDFLNADRLPKLAGPAPLRSAPKDAFAWAFFTRMLFSALVDADRLATEAWSNEAVSDPTLRGWTGSLAEFKSALDTYVDKTFGGAPPDDLARLRAEVLADCRAAARQTPGLFSLTVPTGGGKTLSSLAFALEHAAHNQGRIDRVIYVIPFTSIIDQTAEVFRTALQDVDAILEHQSAFDDEKVARWLAREEDLGLEKLRLATQNWDRPIVVTTAVQFFESLFANSPGRCRKLHNIARSVIILDEAQTLPIKLLRPCLAALNELVRGYGSSVVLCTATQPALGRAEFEKAASSRPPPEALRNVREIIAPDRRLDARLKRVRAEIAEGPLSDGKLVEALASVDRGLVVVNNRRHARELFAGLRKAEVKGARHLTTAMTAAHRQHALGQIREDLKEGRHVRLVSTSLIEAGVDISFAAVWRAWAGLDQIVQAAGRCNRDGKLGPEGGRLVIFEPEPTEGHGIPKELEQNADAARRVLRTGLDPLSPEAVAAYFRELLWTRDDGGQWRALDNVEVGDGEPSYRGIMTATEKTAPGLDFAFADIAQAFRLIEQTMVPIIIPARINAVAGAPEDLLKRIPFAKSLGGIARELQRHVVQIPRRARDALVKAVSARTIEAGKVEQFVELTNPDLYSPEYGLDWDDPTFRHTLIL